MMNGQTTEDAAFEALLAQQAREARATLATLYSREPVTNHEAEPIDRPFVMVPCVRIDCSSEDEARAKAKKLGGKVVHVRRYQ